jgi:hypothetical protein
MDDAKWNLVTDKKAKYAGQKILLGCKLVNQVNFTIWFTLKILFWSTPKKEFVAL